MAVKVLSYQTLVGYSFGLLAANMDGSREMAQGMVTHCRFIINNIFYDILKTIFSINVQYSISVISLACSII